MLVTDDLCSVNKDFGIQLENRAGMVNIRYMWYTYPMCPNFTRARQSIGTSQSIDPFTNIEYLPIDTSMSWYSRIEDVKKWKAAKLTHNYFESLKYVYFCTRSLKPSLCGFLCILKMLHLRIRPLKLLLQPITDHFEYNSQINKTLTVQLY